MLIKRNFREKIIKWLFNIRIKKVHIEYYPSGKKKSKGSLYFLQDHIDEKDGKWTEWHENGKKNLKDNTKMNIGGTDITQTTGKMALKTQKYSVNQYLVNGIIFEDRR